MSQVEHPAGGGRLAGADGEIEDTNGGDEHAGKKPVGPGTGPGPTTQGGIEDTGDEAGGEGDGGGEESNP